MIIKCPECGRQVSEKAPTCPTCGVQIAGKITRCQNCGEIYFTEDGMCPSCHQSGSGNYRPVNPTPRQTVNPQPAVQPTQSPRPSNVSDNNGNGPDRPTPPAPKKKSNKATLVVAFIFAAIVCGGMFYLYHNAKSNKEAEEYEFAMRSTDPDVLQSYLLSYSDAPQEHRDSIEAHLRLLQKGDDDWRNAVLSNSRTALEEYIKNNPESVHCQEARNKIDSLDWVNAQKSNDAETVEQYTTEHPDGRYIDEAKLLLSKLMSTTVQPDEKQMITGIFRQFFQSINSKDESRLTSTVSMVLDTFLGKSNATSQDVITFLHKLYKDDVTNMNWHLDIPSFKINKREVAEEEFEYDVTFSAKQDVEHGESTEEHTYRVSASVSNDGKISGFNLTRLN